MLITIRWHIHIMSVMKNIKPCRHNNAEKMHCRFKHCTHARHPMSLTLIHRVGLALAYRRFWHRFCTAWHPFYNFPDSFSLEMSRMYRWFLVFLSYMHTQACVHVGLHFQTLESLTPSSAEKYWAPRSAAFPSERRLWEKERESLCDIRPWDRKSCRKFDRINGH